MFVPFAFYEIIIFFYIYFSATSVSVGSRYVSESKFCDQCDFVTNHLLILKCHKETKHQGIRYLCDQSEFAAKSPGDLKCHTKSQHEGN